MNVVDLLNPSAFEILTSLTGIGGWIGKYSAMVAEVVITHTRINLLKIKYTSRDCILQLVGTLSNGCGSGRGGKFANTKGD